MYVSLQCQLNIRYILLNPTNGPEYQLAVIRYEISMMFRELGRQQLLHRQVFLPGKTCLA